MTEERNQAIENLNAILALDKEIYERLYQFGEGTVNIMASQRVIEKLRQPRYLDKPPGMMKLSGKDGIQSGCGVLLEYALKEIPEADNEEGEIVMGTIHIPSKPEVVRVIKALIKVGISRNPDLTDATRNLTRKVIMVGSRTIQAGKKLTINKVLEEVVAEGYYEKALFSTIENFYSSEGEN